MTDPIRPAEGTRIEGIKRAIISCRKHEVGRLVHQTESHRAQIIVAKETPTPTIMLTKKPETLSSLRLFV